MDGRSDPTDYVYNLNYTQGPHKRKCLTKRGSEDKVIYRSRRWVVVFESSTESKRDKEFEEG